LGRLNEITILKLGGSLITKKDRRLSPDLGNIKTVAKEVSSALPHISDKLFLIHGGGSFGHFYAKRFGLSRKLGQASSEAIARTTGAMMELHSIVLAELLDAGVPCETIMTSQFLDDRDRLTPSGKHYLNIIWEKGLVPISFGNVFVSPKGARIISGDAIALALTSSLHGRNTRVVFAMDVEGIYPDSSMRGPIIDILQLNHGVKTSEGRFDVTGGVGAKIKVGTELAELGAKVFFVNGSKVQRIRRILSGDDSVKATRIYPEKRAT
jgi:isopentenyl phosphate kinase